MTSPISIPGVVGASKGAVARAGEERGSLSSRKVGDITLAIVFLLEEIEDDIRLSIRLARFDFLSFSSPVEDEDRVDPAVEGGG